MKIRLISIILIILLWLWWWRRWSQQQHDVANIGIAVDTLLSTGVSIDDDEVVPQQQIGYESDPLSNATLLIKKYEIQKDATLLPTIISLLIQSQQYEQAIPYLSMLDKTSDLPKALPVETIFAGLLNGIELNFKNINTLKGLLQKYSDQGVVSKQQFALYSALIAFTRGDYNNYSYFMDQLESTGPFAARKQSFEEIKKQYYAYPKAPTSYLDALIALDIFKRGYINVARTNALQLTQKDSTYILPIQIAAYANIFLGKREDAIQQLNILLDKDLGNKDSYLYFKGIALYKLQKHQESILILSQISTSSVTKEVQQYLFLNFLALQDRKKVHEIIQRLIASPLQTEEYLAFFYPLIWESATKRTEVLQNENLKQSLAELLRKCYQELLPEESFACLYGKTGILYAQGDIDRSYDALRQLVVYYPQDYLYEALASLAQQKGNALLAKKYLLRAWSLKTKEEQTALQQRVMQTLQ
jgi:hypothetical protein